MKFPLRAALFSIALTLAYGGFVLACPETSRELGLDMWNYSDGEKELAATLERGAQLSRYGECVERRISMKQNIVTDVLDGTMTLAEATQQFAYLNQSDPQLNKILLQINPGMDEDEISARQVVGFVRIQPYSDCNLVLLRLESELAKMLRRRPTPAH